MKIAIPVNADRILSHHFGAAEYFAILDVDKEQGSINDMQIYQTEEGGHTAIPLWLKGYGVDMVIAGGMGAYMAENLYQQGIEIFKGAPELPATEVVTLWMDDELELNKYLCETGEHHTQA